MEMANRRNFYRLLQVQPDAPFEVIKNSYRTLLQKLRMHPDLGGEDGSARDLNKAYAILRSASRRAAYDKYLLGRYGLEVLSWGALKRLAVRLGLTAPLSGDKPADTSANRRHYYRLLHVQPDASAAVIDASFNKLKDLKGAPVALLAKAYHVLRQPKRRKHYDLWLVTGEKSHWQSAMVFDASSKVSSVYLSYSDLFAQCSLSLDALGGYGREPFAAACEPACQQYHSPLMQKTGQKPAREGNRELQRMCRQGVITFYTIWPGIEYTALLSDLSPKGLRLRTLRSLRLGQMLKINGQGFKAVGRVMHTRMSDRQTMAGVEFDVIKFGGPCGNFVSYLV
jgi:curved DNA-binding protein CbpA